MSEILTAVSAIAAVDARDMAGPDLLRELKMPFEASRRLDAAIVMSLQAMDARDVTLRERGCTTTSWLIDEKHLSPAEADRLMRAARPLSSQNHSDPSRPG
jgi:hypothetical protein